MGRDLNRERPRCAAAPGWTDISASPGCRNERNWRPGRWRSSPSGARAPPYLSVFRRPRWRQRTSITESAMKTIRILLADDHAVMREGLVLLINSQRDMRVVGQANDGREAIEQARLLRPDVAVLD